MTAETDLFVEEARAVTIAEAAVRLGLAFRRGKQAEHPQACPACGGKDTFAFNTQKQMWNCRKGGAGGKDAIGMAAHVLGLELSRRDGFLAACEAVTGRPLPDGAERESEADRLAREKRLADQREKNAAEAAARAADQVDFRETERARARIIHEAAARIGVGAGEWASLYLAARGCMPVPDARWLRASADLPYWHGEDGRGRPAVLFSGPAMVAPFLAPDMNVIGCHISWIDLDCPPKFRPVLFELTDTGRAAGRRPWSFGDRWPTPEDLAEGLYRTLPSKKMRGSKKGGLIPIAGEPRATRWVGGEGIENGAAFAGWEGFRRDTFYFSAGDIGNLSGPAAGRFAHPTLTTTDKAGRTRPMMIPDAVPKPDQAPDDAMWVGDHVTEMVLLGDGDSEPVWTAAAMARGRARLARPGRTIYIAWPRRGGDFAGMAHATNGQA